MSKQRAILGQLRQEIIGTHPVPHAPAILAFLGGLFGEGQRLADVGENVALEKEGVVLGLELQVVAIAWPPTALLSQREAGREGGREERGRRRGGRGTRRGGRKGGGVLKES